jgi:hypothetical protein
MCAILNAKHSAVLQECQRRIESVRERTHLVQNKRYGNECKRYESECRACPGHAEVAVHSRREQWETCAEGSPEKVVPCKYGGGIVGIRIGKIIHNRDKQEKSSDREPRRTNDRHNPVNAWSGAPTEPKKADGNRKGANAGRGQSDLWCHSTLLVEFRLQILIHPPVERRDGDDCPDQDSDE